jgi:hypothetical protein
VILVQRGGDLRRLTGRGVVVELFDDPRNDRLDQLVGLRRLQSDLWNERGDCLGGERPAEHIENIRHDVHRR